MAIATLSPVTLTANTAVETILLVNTSTQALPLLITSRLPPTKPARRVITTSLLPPTTPVVQPLALPLALITIMNQRPHSLPTPSQLVFPASALNPAT